MIVEKIQAFLNAKNQGVDEAILTDVGLSAKIAFLRQFMEREKSSRTMRLSSIGKCLRQQAYNVLGFEQKGKEIDARARMVFFQGDLAEIAIVQLARAAGCEIDSIGQSQRVVEIDGIEGHPDGILHDPSGDYLFEAKSMSSYAYRDFERGILEEGYRYQINAYMHALGLKRAIVVGLNKDAGVLHEMPVSKDPAIVADILSRINLLKTVKKEKLPERPYKPNDKGFYPWNCLYCAFHQTCLPDAEKVVVSKAYKLKETKNSKNKIQGGYIATPPTPQN